MELRSGIFISQSQLQILCILCRVPHETDELSTGHESATIIIVCDIHSYVYFNAHIYYIQLFKVSLRNCASSKSWSF